MPIVEHHTFSGPVGLVAKLGTSSPDTYSEAGVLKTGRACHFFWRRGKSRI